MRHLLLGFALLCAGGEALAAQVVIGPDLDNTMFDSAADTSDGAGQGFYVGRNNGTPPAGERRGLIHFDVAGAVPAGATIDAVTLTLRLAQANGTPGTIDVELHALTASWGEGASNSDGMGAGGGGGGDVAQVGDATWAYRFWDATTPVSWTTAGGDFSATVSASVAIGNNAFLGTDYDWTSATLASDVQAWLDTPATNFGWLLEAPGAAASQSRRFHSKESPVPAARPRLTITFTPLTIVGACCHPDGTCTVVDSPGTLCIDVYSGDNTVCLPNDCPQPAWVCCEPDATAACTLETEAACTAGGRVPVVGDDTCDMADCPVILTPFIDPLPIPKVATPVSGTQGGAAHYDIAFREITQVLHSELPATTVWVYDDGTGGTYPGPTIEASSGQQVQVTWRNDIRDEFGALRTTHLLDVDHCAHGAEDDSVRAVVHLHGAHVPAAYDGHPELTLLPGQSTDYFYPNQQDAATLWYHDHALGITRLNVYMGLAAFYILRSPEENALGLPSGQYEIPLVLQDREIAPDGTLMYHDHIESHFGGSKILVNGAVWPYLDVDQGKYRFRVLNGSGSRTFRLTLSDGSKWTIIGSDGGLLEAPITVDELLVAPAERWDVIVDFEGQAASTEITVDNDAPLPFPGGPGVGVVPEVMKFVVSANAGDTDALPASLRTITPLNPADAARTRDFILSSMPDGCGGSMWMINDLHWDDVTEFPVLGTQEIWRFANDSGFMHPMHIHLSMFQVLDRMPVTIAGGDITPAGPAVLPSAEESGWKDTVEVNPGEAVRVMLPFDDYTGSFAYHCHILEHEDHEMMRQFMATTVCGDGTLGIPAEVCDEGGETATCDADCTPVSCGDGEWNAAAGEACDDGIDSADCNDDCTLAECGDSKLNTAAGEDCDDGAESIDCDDDCTVVSCGDGTTNTLAAETCDDGGESATCDDDCTLPSCGDGNSNAAAGELCDDGNAVTGDGCSSECQIEDIDGGDVDGGDSDQPGDVRGKSGCGCDGGPADLGWILAVAALRRLKRKTK